MMWKVGIFFPIEGTKGTFLEKRKNTKKGKGFTKIVVLLNKWGPSSHYGFKWRGF